MKTTTLKTTPPPKKKRIGQFANEAKFLAAERKRFDDVFGKVDWEQARKNGLI